MQEAAKWGEERARLPNPWWNNPLADWSTDATHCPLLAEKEKAGQRISQEAIKKAVSEYLLPKMRCEI